MSKDKSIYDIREKIYTNVEEYIYYVLDYLDYNQDYSIEFTNDYSDTGLNFRGIYITHKCFDKRHFIHNEFRTGEDVDGTLYYRTIPMDEFKDILDMYITDLKLKLQN